MPGPLALCNLSLILALYQLRYKLYLINTVFFMFFWKKFCLFTWWEKGEVAWTITENFPFLQSFFIVQISLSLLSLTCSEEKQTTMSTSERYDCHYCKDSLLGKKYIMKEDTQYCTKCYENLFANCCESCSLPIGCNCKVREILTGMRLIVFISLMHTVRICMFIFVIIFMLHTKFDVPPVLQLYLHVSLHI